MITLPFLNKKTKSEEKYLGLLLKEQDGVLMILAKEEGRLVLQEKINFSYSNGWENLTDDVDENLSLLTLGKEKILKLIIFTYSHLVDQATKQIQRPLLSSIKKMVEELAFSPLGYIEVGEAVASFLQKEENLPLNSILVEIDKTQLSIFVYKNNQIVFKKVVSRTDNFIDDLLTVFKEKGKEFLPSKIILYNSKDLDEKAEAILSYRWPPEYFLQLPKVAIIKEEEVIKAVIFIFETQLKEEGDFLKEKEEKKEERMGFLIGKDIKEVSLVEKKESFFEKFLYFRFKLPSLKNLSFSFPKISFKVRLPSFSLPFFVFLLLLGGFFVNEWFFHKLTLTLYPETKKLEKEMALLGSLKKEDGFDKLPINKKEQELSFSSSKKTTGEKEIGQKAKGEVIIFNSDLDSSYTLPKETVLVSESGLKFFLEEEVKVASASGDASNLKPSTAKGKVVALSIGSEYNLKEGSKFLIEGKSKNIIAKNETPFSGGTRNKIKTVSKDDLEELRKKIKEEAKKNWPILDKDKKIIFDLTEVELKEEEFSKELGEEAEEVSLKAKVSKKFYLYDENQLKNRVVFFLQKELPSGFKIKKETLKASLLEAKKEEKDNLSLRFKIEGKAAFEVPILALKKDLIFVSKEKMADILKDKYKIGRYDFRLSPGLLIFEKTPLFDKNIEVKISY
jgi:hypothetical protein